MQFIKLEKIPFFYRVLKKIITHSLLKGGNWEAELIHADNKRFTVHVYKCLWHDATVENGCPELCRVFCECDDINFDVFSKVKFYRQGALGMEANKCDFTFKKVR